MDDVVRIAVEVALTRLGPDDVVRRSDKLLERTGVLGVVPQGAKRLHYGQSAATLPSVLGPRLEPWLRSPSSSRTGSSRASMRSPRRSGFAHGRAPRTSRSSSSIRAAVSRRGSGATWTCSTAALVKATP